MLACGDWEGNIRIHDLTNDKLEEKQCIEAHENEILSLDFAQTEHSKSGSILIPDQGKEHGTTNSILVSGSRDQLVQLYDCSNSFEPVQIIESHVNSVTAVRFTNEKDQPVESVTPGGPRT
jgi:WD40 repeat protein